MFRKIILVMSFLMLMFISTYAQENHTVSFGDFSFVLDSELALNVSIRQVPVPEPGFPELPHAEIKLHNSYNSEPSLALDVATIRIYNTADLTNTEFFAAPYEALQTLLSERPDLIAYEAPNTVNALPFLPFVAAGQVLRARISYTELAGLSGVSYLLVYTEVAEPFTSHSLWYTFQGISEDGSQYLTAVVPLTTTLYSDELPQNFDITTFVENIDSYITENVALLNEAPVDAFSPSLDTLNSLFTSFNFETIH